MWGIGMSDTGNYFPKRNYFFRRVGRRYSLKSAPSLHIGEFIETCNGNPHQIFRAAMVGMLNATFNRYIMIYHDPAMYMINAIGSKIIIPESSFYLRVHSYNPRTEGSILGLTGKEDEYRYYEFRYRTGSGAPFVVRRERDITKRWSSEQTFEKYLQRQAMKMYCVYLNDAPTYTHFTSGNESFVHRYISDTLKSDRAEFLINTKEEL